MKTAILGSVLLLTLPLAAQAAESDLYGTWKVGDAGATEYPRGKAPTGYVSFGRDGRVTGVIASEKRPRPESVAKMTDQQRIELFNTMNAYGGTYKLDGNKLTYRFDITHNELGEQRASVREIKFEGRKLTIRAARFTVAVLPRACMARRHRVPSSRSTTQASTREAPRITVCAAAKASEERPNRATSPSLAAGTGRRGEEWGSTPPTPSTTATR